MQAEYRRSVRSDAVQVSMYIFIILVALSFVQVAAVLKEDEDSEARPTLVSQCINLAIPSWVGLLLTLIANKRLAVMDAVGPMFITSIILTRIVYDVIN